jgi:hypothetical protein
MNPRRRAIQRAALQAARDSFKRGEEPPKSGEVDGLISLDRKANYGKCSLSGLKEKLDTPRGSKATWDYNGKANKHGKARQVELEPGHVREVDTLASARMESRQTQRPTAKRQPALKTGGAYRRRTIETVVGGAMYAVDITRAVRANVDMTTTHEEVEVLKAKVKGLTTKQKRTLARKLASD